MMVYGAPLFSPQACSFFNSNAVPLKVTMVSADPLGEEINSMFKVRSLMRELLAAIDEISCR